MPDFCGEQKFIDVRPCGTRFVPLRCEQSLEVTMKGRTVPLSLDGDTRKLAPPVPNLITSGTRGLRDHRPEFRRIRGRLAGPSDVVVVSIHQPRTPSHQSGYRLPSRDALDALSCVTSCGSQSGRVGLAGLSMAPRQGIGPEHSQDCALEAECRLDKRPGLEEPAEHSTEHQASVDQRHRGRIECMRLLNDSGASLGRGRRILGSGHTLAVLLLVPAVGLEPTRPLGQSILSAPRLPFRHAGPPRHYRSGPLAPCVNRRFVSALSSPSPMR